MKMHCNAKVVLLLRLPVKIWNSTGKCTGHQYVEYALRKYHVMRLNAMQELMVRSLTLVLYVKKNSPERCARNIMKRLYMLEQKSSCAVTVANLTQRSKPSLTIKGPTQGKSHILVANALNHLLPIQQEIVTQDSSMLMAQSSNHSNVINVQNPFYLNKVWILIEEYTLGKNHLPVKRVQKHFQVRAI